MRKGILRKCLCLILCTAMMLGIFGMNETFVVKVMAETTYNIDSDKLPYTQEEIFRLISVPNKSKEQAVCLLALQDVQWCSFRAVLTVPLQPG